MSTKNTSKNINLFECKNCDFNCSKKGDWNRHLLTRKHINSTTTTEITSNYIICECGKKYKERTALWRHKKKCNYEEKPEKKEEEEEEDNVSYKDLLIQAMADLKKKDEQLDKIIELIPKIGNTTNTQNNNFNLQIFLNEDCKDALNIKDFVSSLKLQLKDLDNTGKLGFVEGTSKIFIDGLNKLEVTKRPIHCSDINEETLYIKDNDTWGKENKNKDKMKNAIDEITDINMKQMPEWLKNNPKFTNDEEYLKVISNIMNVIDQGKENKQKEKIINNVAKETFIDE
jgi:hypothetical protein